MIFGAILLAAPVVAEQPNNPFKRDVVLTFAQCVYRQSADKARSLLTTPPGSDREHAIIGTLVGRHDGCIGERQVLSFPTALLRGQLAEVAFANDPSLSQAVAKVAPQPINVPNDAELTTQVAKVDVKYRDQRFVELFRQAYARCLVQANPQGVARLLPTASGSVAERDALLAVGTSLSSCMPQGIRYSIKPAELRPYLLSALYYAAASASAGS